MVAAAICVRSKRALLLLGTTETKPKGSKLPSKRQVLCLFFHYHKTLKKTVCESARAVIREALLFWDKARIPIRPEQHAIHQLEQLHEQWVKLKKNAGRKSETQQVKENEFANNLDDLFDIAHMNALQIIKIQEDRDFLMAQREKGRRGCMGQVDKVHSAKESKALKRKHLYEEFKQRSDMERHTLDKSVIFESSSSDSESITGTSINTTASTSLSSIKKRARVNIVTTDLAVALDRAKVSDQKATLLLTATAQSLGHNIDDFNINRSSIHRCREHTRAELANSLKDHFKPTVPLIVHWDGKHLSDLTGREMVDRLLVILSGEGVDQPIRVPKLVESTGKAQADAVAHFLDRWGVAAMCFHTTSNMGHTNATCVLLEQKLKKTFCP